MKLKQIFQINLKILNFWEMFIIGKFIKISSKGDFGNNKFLDISLKMTKKKKNI